MKTYEERRLLAITIIIMICIFLVTFLSSCQVHQVCSLDYTHVRITGIEKNLHIYECESLDGKCYGSFKSYAKLTVGDTVFIGHATINNLTTNTPPTVEIL